MKTDLISRADAIDAIDDAIDANSPQWAILRTKIGFLPSAETTGALDDAIAKYVADGLMELPTDGDLIRREDAFGAVQDHFDDDGFKGYFDEQKMTDRIKALPSVTRAIQGR